MARKQTARETPLRRLVAKGNELSEDVLADLLEPYLQFTEDGDTRFEEAFHKLKAKDQLLVALLARLAASKLGLAEKPTLTPKEISQLTGLPEGTVKPRLRGLAKEKLVRSDKGKYDVPPYSSRLVETRVKALRAEREEAKT